LRHPEIQADKVETSPEPVPYLGSDDTPKTSHQVRDLGKNKSPSTRRRYAVIARGFEAQEQVNAEHASRIASLEEEVARLKRGKKRKTIPNPNRRFMTLSETLAMGEAIPEVRGQEVPVVVDSEAEEEVFSEIEVAPETEIESEPEASQTYTRSGRLIKKRRYE
jgi:hypothetical protein